MPAEKKEIEDAKNEGIDFLFLTNIVKILGKDKVKQIECIKTELIKIEGEERKKSVNIENSNYIMDIDYVVTAVGGEIDNHIIQQNNLKISKNNYIQVDENNKTSCEKVFAGGNVIGQLSTVAWAARDGREVAKKIAEYLK